MYGDFDMFAWLSRLFSTTSVETPRSVSAPVMSTGELAAAIEEPPTARNAAYNRLRLVLMHDRTQLEPSVLEQMRIDIVQVISKYVNIDEGAIEINLETDTDTNTVALVASIPMVSARRGLGAEECAEGEATTSVQTEINEPVAAV
jgi:cell division topological specificity factor